MESISVIIVNYNAGPLLIKCIESICHLGEIIVIDNASNDCSIEACQHHFDKKISIQYIRNKTNLGFAVACNMGILQSKKPYLFFLNPDCVVEKNAVEQLYETFMLDPTIGMVGGLLLNTDGSAQVGARRVIPTPWRAFVRAFGLYHLQHVAPRVFANFDLYQQPIPKQAVEVESISGACMLVKQAAITDVGELDEHYFMHCEDLDWCMRFRAKQWKIFFQPLARIMHQQGACSAGRPFFVEWHKHKGMLRFYKKFFRQRYFYLPAWLIGVSVLLHYTITAALIFIKKLNEHIWEKYHAS